MQGDPKQRAYSFDPACYSLAEHFLGTSASEDRKRDLAQDIQNTVELFDHMGIDLAGEAPVTDKGKIYTADRPVTDPTDGGGNAG